MAQLVTLLKQESILVDQNEDRKFVIVAPPQIIFLHGRNRSSRIYVCDGDKGVTVFMDFVQSKALVELKTDAQMISNILDSSILARLSKIRPDNRLMVGMAFFAGFIGFLLGIMF